MLKSLGKSLATGIWNKGKNNMGTIINGSLITAGMYGAYKLGHNNKPENVPMENTSQRRQITAKEGQ